MGLFDNFIKQIDNGLKAVESGALEDKLNKFADTIDKTSERAEKTLKQAADKPAELIKQAETGRAAIENRAVNMQQHIKRNIDIIQKRS